VGVGGRVKQGREFVFIVWMIVEGTATDCSRKFDRMFG
jgi:hypothetical protein